MKTESALPDSPILIVDDDPDICLALEDQLRYLGYTVCSVMMGREALHEAEQRSYGAVILDLGLPDLSGLAVLRGLRRKDGTVISVEVSASKMSDNRCLIIVRNRTR